jgi:hypothetical protein
LVTAAAAAQVTPPETLPARPITLIVPFPAGGPSDALARALAQGMGSHLKQAIVVENISGASGTIGLAKLVKSPPDGATLAFGTIGTHVANVALYKKLPYDPLADFDPVGLAGTAPCAALAAGVQPAGVRRLRRRKPRQGDLRQRRGRLDLALRLRHPVVRAQAEHQSCALSRRRPGHERPHGRAHRRHVRPVDHRVAAGHWR